MAQFGSVLGSGPRGRGFESRHSDQKNPFCLCRTDFFMQRKAAAYGFLCGLRLCERGYIKNKTAGLCKFTGEKQKTPRRGAFLWNYSPQNIIIPKR